MGYQTREFSLREKATVFAKKYSVELLYFIFGGFFEFVFARRYKNATLVFLHSILVFQ